MKFAPAPEFNSGLPLTARERGEVNSSTLRDALNRLGARVKGYGSRATPETKHITARIIGESREDQYAGWHDVLSDDEMRTRRLMRVNTPDTTKAEQLVLF